MMMVVRILQKVTKDLEEHKQHCQEFFMREMEKQKNYTICTQLHCNSFLGKIQAWPCSKLIV